MSASSWRIYYRGGKVFGSDDGPWSEAPADGVLAVAFVIGEARKIASGGDYYRLCEDGSVVCHEDHSALTHAIGRVQMSTILHGWCTSPTEMNRVFAQIEADHAR